ncbi:MAG: 2-dehydro-3-deoxyphosphooctonate aldolase [Flavobacterium sp.]|nr:2-dehydro-3-deoxyphosphooctonate aldolase [Flavobacterium sp.]
MRNFLILLLIAVSSVGCVSTKNTIRNIDNNAPVPRLDKNDNFIVTDFSTDRKYGYDPDYPVNVFFRNTANDSINQKRYLNALAGPNGEKIFFRKVDTCCPFPSEHSVMGAGYLDIYEISWVGQKKPIRLYINIYEKGLLKVPMGMGLKPQ